MKPSLFMGALASAFAFSSTTVASGAASGLELTFSETERAVATLTVVEESVCADGSAGLTETSIVINPVSETVRGTLGSSASLVLNVDFFELDTCTGQLRHTFRRVDDPDYAQRGLSSAALTGSFELIDVSEPLGTLVIDIELDGTGRVTRSSSSSSSESGDTRIVSITQEASRSADISGSVTLDGVEFLGDTAFTQLTTIRTTEIHVPR